MKKDHPLENSELPSPRRNNFGRRATDWEKPATIIDPTVPMADDSNADVGIPAEAEGIRHRKSDGEISPIERELIREFRDIGSSLKKLDETLNLIREHEFVELHSSKWKIFAYQIFLGILFAIGTVLGLVLLSWMTYTFFKDSTVLRNIVDSQLQMRRFNIDQIKEKAVKDAEDSTFLQGGKSKNEKATTPSASSSAKKPVQTEKPEAAKPSIPAAASTEKSDVGSGTEGDSAGPKSSTGSNAQSPVPEDSAASAETAKPKTETDDVPAGTGTSLSGMSDS